MRNRSGKLDVTHTLTSYLGTGNFNAAAFADLALEADLLVLSAVALPVLAGSEYLLTEQSVLFRLHCSVVDGLRLFYLAVGPLSDLLR